MKYLVRHWINVDMIAEEVIDGDGVDLKIRLMLTDLGTSESSGTTLAQSIILKLAKSVYGEDKAYFPIEGVIWINTSALPNLLNERAILNNTNLPKLCTTMIRYHKGEIKCQHQQ